MWQIPQWKRWCVRSVSIWSCRFWIFSTLSIESAANKSQNLLWYWEEPYFFKINTVQSVYSSKTHPLHFITIMCFFKALDIEFAAGSSAGSLRPDSDTVRKIPGLRPGPVCIPGFFSALLMRPLKVVLEILARGTPCIFAMREQSCAVGNFAIVQ